MPVVSLIKENDLIAGAVIRDLETGQEYQIRARAVINATRKMDEPEPRRHKIRQKASGTRGDEADEVPCHRLHQATTLACEREWPFF